MDAIIGVNLGKGKQNPLPRFGMGLFIVTLSEAKGLFVNAEMLRWLSA